jgi:hypothetical protein
MKLPSPTGRGTFALASAIYLGAAKLHGSGDHKAADKHSKDTRDHTTMSSQVVAQVDKFSGPGRSDHNS